MENQPRILYIDIIKGIGIIMVLISHLLPFRFMCMFIEPVFIPLFFIVSGMLTPDQITSNILKRRSISLLVPYFAIVLVFSIMACAGVLDWTFWNYIGVLYSRSEILWGNNKLHLLSYELGPLWFLTSMSSTYMLLYLVDQIKCNLTIKIILLAITTYFLNFGYLCLPWSLENTFLFAAYFNMGRLILQMNSYKLYIWFLPAIYITLIQFTGAINLSLNNYGNNFFLTMLTANIGFLMLREIALCLGIHSSLISKALSWAGRNSISFMVIHLPIHVIMIKLISPPYSQPFTIIMCCMVAPYLSTTFRALTRCCLRKFDNFA